MLTPQEVLALYPPHHSTLKGLFESRASRDPDRVFLTFEGQSHSWAEFGDLTERVARVLVRHGTGVGDRVAVIGRNSPWHIALLLALARIGAIMVPVNPEFREAEMRYVLEHAGVSGVVSSADALGTARRAASGVLPSPWFASLDEQAEGVQSMAALAAGQTEGPVSDAGSPDHTCLIIYTSGTTGFPKGVMHSQRTLVLVGEASVQRVHMQATDSVMIMLPMFHINALFYSTGGALAAGARIVLVPRFSASTFWDTVADNGVTQVNVIETIGLILKARPRNEFRPDHKLRVVYGVRANAAETFRNEFGVPFLVSGYGMTEIPGALCPPLVGPDKPGTMGVLGQHPDPDQEWSTCRVVDEAGADVADGEVGELIVRTPIIMQGYFRDPEQTAAAFRDGWFLTGDLVRRDADGYYYFFSRKKEIIRRRGENISAAELERVIGQHPGVGEVAALAVPSELGEDEIMVAITPPESGAPADAQSIADWCRERLAENKTPRYVSFVKELPRTPTHKIARLALRQDEALRRDAIDLQKRPRP